MKFQIFLFIAFICGIRPWNQPNRLLFMVSEYSSIRKVAIVGSGIAGMGAAACLKVLAKRNPSSSLRAIDIFESRRNYLQSRLGGGIQLSGGAKIIEKLGFHSELMSVASRLEGITCRNADDKILYDINLKRTIEKQGNTELISSSTGESLFCTVMRDALLSLLHNITTDDNTPRSPSTTQRTAKLASNPAITMYPEHKCLDVTEGSNKQLRLTCNGDRVYDDYDLVILADGVNSLFKQPQLGLKDILGRSLDRSASDTGIRITYCVLPADVTSSSSFQQFMGDGVYALIGKYGGLHQRSYSMLAIVYKVEEGGAEGSENTEWTLSRLSEKAIRSKLKRGGLDQNPAIQQILHRLFDIERKRSGGKEEADCRIFDLSVKNRFIPLSSWSSMEGRVVLLGDAAHAMAPFFGQGANQALQDAYCLADLVHRYNDNDNRNKGSIGEVSREYEKKRKWSVSKLVAKSYVLGQLEMLGGAIGTPAKDIIFQTLFQLGITEKEFLEAASPVI